MDHDGKIQREPLIPFIIWLNQSCELIPIKPQTIILPRNLSLVPLCIEQSLFFRCLFSIKPREDDRQQIWCLNTTKVISEHLSVFITPQEHVSLLPAACDLVKRLRLTRWEAVHQHGSQKHIFPLPSCVILSTCLRTANQITFSEKSKKCLFSSNISICLSFQWS